jgi:basic membrane protein A
VNAITLKRSLAGFAALSAAALVLAGCAAAPEAPATDAEAPAPAVEQIDFRACAVSDEASWNDNSFNQAVLAGLEKAQAELGVQITAAESLTPDDYAPNLQEMVDADCDIIIAVGFNLVDAVNAAADANPDKNFVTIDGYSMGATNLKTVAFAMEESSYLAGYLAAANSKSKVIGTFGGEKIEVLYPFMSGYYYGAQAWASEFGQPVTVLGWDPATQNGDFVGSWTDTGVAKSISLAQLEAGADVIFPVAGGLFAATAEAISETGADAVMFGVDADVALTSPQFAGVVLTSVEKRMTNATFDIIRDTLETGTFNTETYLGTLANGGTGLSSFYDFDGSIDAGIKSRLAELQAEIIAGTIKPLG